MALRFIAKDPGSRFNDSPTVYVDEVTGDYVLQGWRITDDETLAQIRSLPDSETVIRFPARMIPLLSRVHAEDAADD